MCSVSAFQTCSSQTTAPDGEVIGENLAMYSLCAWKPGLCPEGRAASSVQHKCVYKHHPGCAWEQGLMAGLIPSSSPSASSGKGAGSWRFALKMKTNPRLLWHCVVCWLIIIYQRVCWCSKAWVVDAPDFLLRCHKYEPKSVEHIKKNSNELIQN